jgi:hypothetical protein
VLSKLDFRHISINTSKYHTEQAIGWLRFVTSYLHALKARSLLVVCNMPIVVTDIEWEQTADEVILRVPLKGIPTKKVDIYGRYSQSLYFFGYSSNVHTKLDCSVNSAYVKVNFQPFFYEVDLYFDIQPENSKVVLEGGYAHFRLKKVSIPIHTCMCTT